jgi:hypothetical protein
MVDEIQPNATQGGLYRNRVLNKSNLTSFEELE